MSDNTFTLTWKDAKKEPPKEGGRYWCVIREVNDLGMSYFQWNCAYSPNEKWTDDFIIYDVIYWVELPNIPI